VHLADVGGGVEPALEALGGPALVDDLTVAVKRLVGDDADDRTRPVRLLDDLADRNVQVDPGRVVLYEASW
jgi:hypothetical protein